ncbi:hypothetical protein V1512DRAFT_263818 [Lipomyces arxii]|uniref:uncharacterized protein n=1 Tax=Lipomyces arxii TaxID=56418 RepID=UPI0034CD3EEB
MSNRYGSYSQVADTIDDPEWNRYNDLVEQDPGNLEHWENLIRATESIEGGFGRGTSPELITQARRIFDGLLTRFPLLFGYWQRYADVEFSMAGSDTAEAVYRRGVAGIPNSVELWTSYCAFKMETSSDEEEVRVLFSTAAESVGLDFLSHTFWDKYLEFEARLERQDLVVHILEKISLIPMHQYARYFERYTQVAATRPTHELVTKEELQKLTTLLEADSAKSREPKSAVEIERELRLRIHKTHVLRFTDIQQQTMRRWPFESEIKRQYFHVKPLEETELINWRKYLDFEEIEGDAKRVRFLYEKCLVATALYDEFWFRYVRWLSAQPVDNEEEIRNVYRRASTLFVPVGRPSFRINYAYFEEGAGEHNRARDILDAILVELPGNLETIIARANLERRLSGVDAAIDIYRQLLQSSSCDVYVRGSLVAEWARLLYTVKGDVKAARKAFADNADEYLDSRYFWIGYLQFEIGIPSSLDTEAERFKCISRVHRDIRTKTRLPPFVIKDLSHIYMVYLLERGGSHAIKEYNRLDREVNG